MNFHRFIPVLALVAISTSAFAAMVANPTLLINVKVNINVANRIEWSNGAVATRDQARTWTIVDADLNTAYSTKANVVGVNYVQDNLLANVVNGLAVTNRSNFPSNLTIGITAENPWTAGLIAAHTQFSVDLYVMRASTAGAATITEDTMDGVTGGIAVAGVGWTINIPVLAATAPLAGPLAHNQGTPVDLEFITPFTVSAMAAGINNTTLTITSTLL